MKSKDLRLGKGRPKVRPSRPRAMKSKDLLVGKGRPKVSPRRPRAMKSKIADSVTDVRKSYTCYEIVFEGKGSPKVHQQRHSQNIVWGTRAGITCLFLACLGYLCVA